ncbi:LD-carboxypeptidase [Granulosicoccaceae sp. 1_MG-2023]|nr:LD-carboxypeptidase [Granulosicoccaceae sp. 1_MG-2023]
MFALSPGDTVALIAPSGAQSSAQAELPAQAAALLASWDLQVRDLSASARHLYLAGDDEARGAALCEALTDPQIRGIFCTRGGYGAPRLLPLIRRGMVPSPRLLCGFSDITVLLQACEARLPAVLPVHGPNLATPGLLGADADATANRERLRQLVFGTAAVIDMPLEVIRAGEADAPLTGGCLSLIAHLLGTPLEPDFRGKVLFLEDVGEKPYVIDRLLTQLRLAGKFNRLAGLVFGDMQGCSDGVNPLAQVIADCLGPVPFPVLFGLPAGHGPRNLAFALGQRARISAAGRLQIA